ncbi:MAG TPA: hypothetical protein VGD09_01600 [Blastococcus sp.]
MLAVAEQHGVRILEVEYLTAWGTAADRDEAQQRKEQTVFHMARAFGVHHLNAGLLEKLPLDVMTDAFAALCERAGPDLTVALEFMPTTASRPRHGLADRGGVPNATLIIDNRRRARAGQNPADLDEVPAERIVSVQLCDVRAEPMKPLRAESLARRLAPGQGYGDTVGLVRAGGTRRHPRRHGGGGDLRRAGGPRRGRRRAGDGGRGPRGSRPCRDRLNTWALTAPVPCLFFPALVAA